MSARALCTEVAHKCILFRQREATSSLLHATPWDQVDYGNANNLTLISRCQKFVLSRITGGPQFGYPVLLGQRLAMVRRATTDFPGKTACVRPKSISNPK
jgi:hypothetical protein